jgi:hypothetical protein
MVYTQPGSSSLESVLGADTREDLAWGFEHVNGNLGFFCQMWTQKGAKLSSFQKSTYYAGIKISINSPFRQIT